MAQDVAFQVTNNEQLDTAQVADVQPNFNAIQANFEAIMAAFNALNAEVGAGNTPDLNLVTVNTANFDGFMSGLSGNQTLQQFADAVDNRVGSNLSLDASGLNNSLDGFRTATGLKNVQTFMEFCDNSLQPLIQVTPGITNFRLNFPLVQANGFSIFDDLTNATRTFNADLTGAGMFTRVEIKANGTEIATYTTLANSVRNQLIPDIVQQEADWDTAVAAGGTDAAGRTIVNIVLEGFLPSPAANIVSNTVQVLIGAAAQTETIYHDLSIEANGVTIGEFLLSESMAVGNPSTISLNETPITLNTMPVYWHVLIPSKFDSVTFTQVTPLGNIPANNYFPNFSSPPTRTIGGETYNVYTSSALVPGFNANFTLRVEDTS